MPHQGQTRTVHLVVAYHVTRESTISFSIMARSVAVFWQHVEVLTAPPEFARGSWERCGRVRILRGSGPPEFVWLYTTFITTRSPDSF